MIPLWKVRREIDGLRQQIAAIPELLFGAARQRRLDRRFPETCRIVDGDAPLAGKVAIFLVFQPHGMAASVLATCRHLRQRGYAVLLVANSPVSAADRVALRDCVWRFAERTNFGYDFGGYRDGIRLLWHWSVAPEQLIILNDSVWFPLHDDETLLQTMEDSAAGFVGAMRYLGPGEAETPHAGIFMSYFFLLKRPVLQSQTFVDYWTHYVSTSNKLLTLRRGERAFSRRLFAAGIASEGIYSHARLLRALAGQPCDVLRRTLDYAAYTDADLQAERDALLAGYADGEAWRMQALAHVRAAVERRNFLSLFCYPCIRLLGIPFIKKNRGELQLRMRRQYLRAVQAGELPAPAPEVLAEIAASVGER